MQPADHRLNLPKDNFPFFVYHIRMKKMVSGICVRRVRPLRNFIQSIRSAVLAVLTSRWNETVAATANGRRMTVGTLQLPLLGSKQEGR